MFPETALHLLEFVNAVHSFRLILAVHKAGERGAESFATGPICHASETGAVPVDLAGLLIERAFTVGGVLEVLRVLFIGVMRFER